ncbi:FXYD domain-containing ion transport regulator 5 isoform X1 [Pteropus alecto]|uniref:FXYD domain-containing ion transport regulator 5 isoform X1 n=2 Tax=Pteropus alecto TaxID=9402 RepID=UPI0007688BC0|nr:FXYD domain-containing ion transport regulator 5 isoform X1 [Pteropus alecto]XP_015451096.1 FXYD domain-containing ion transport regulator 5 isoform X1 [Pteropus alecto]XP_024894298.1 FXYD domain-containing ion transport regulator 5 isoform X1 [Pteropus alecto]XP_024894299.1 FXYD domain-containing ion transport regulator 5 isoform X1 [Pteropus alecto]
MSPSVHLCLVTIVGLILPTRGQTLEKTTPISLVDSATVNTVNIRVPTETSDTVRPELQSTLQTSTLQAGVETTQTQTETQKQQPTGMDVLLITDPGTDKSSMEGSSEDDPFSYDEVTLRKRGLIVAAVLFITGIVILTSGKCRQLPRLCRNYNRAYSIMSKAQLEREDTDGARARADGLSPLPSQPSLP